LGSTAPTQPAPSVERDNLAVGLYERLGFRPLKPKGNTLTMIIDLLGRPVIGRRTARSLP